MPRSGLFSLAWSESQLKKGGGSGKVVLKFVTFERILMFWKNRSNFHPLGFWGWDREPKIGHVLDVTNR